MECREDDVSVRGIPGFWLRVMKMCPDVADDISERDEEVLQYLERIFCEVLEDGISFRLSFLFRKNRFFRNRFLTKTYSLENSRELVLKESLGTKIQWSSPSTNVTMAMVSSGRRKRGGKPKMVETESFFHFFEPPNTDTLEDEDASGAEIAALEMEMEADLELGQVFREKIIPLAFRFYGGEMGTTEESDFDSEPEDTDDSEGEVSAAKAAFQPFVVKGPPRRDE
jgi:nucleosome assembly protein 1-like 1